MKLKEQLEERNISMAGSLKEEKINNYKIQFQSYKTE
jgi:hypothetical protein